MTDGTGTYTYTYSDRGDLLSVTYPGGKVVNYAFDVIGQRPALTLSGYGTTTYLYYDNGAQTTLKSIVRASLVAPA